MSVPARIRISSMMILFVLCSVLSDWPCAWGEEENLETVIDFSGTLVKVTCFGTSPDSVRTEGNQVFLNAPGEYVISGSADGVQITAEIDKETFPDSTVTLTLLGAELSNDNGPVLILRGMSEGIVRVKKGTRNSITCTREADEEDAVSAAVYAESNLTFKGSGALDINSTGKYGILCRKTLRLWNGTLNVTSDGSGIRGKDAVRIGNPEDGGSSGLVLNVTANGGEGIRASESDQERAMWRSTGAQSTSGRNSTAFALPRISTSMAARWSFSRTKGQTTGVVRKE